MKNWKTENNVSVRDETEGMEGERGTEKTLKEIHT